MLTVEIKINGMVVGMIYSANKGKNFEKEEFNNYKFEYWRPGEGVISRGTLLHKPEDGVEVLAQSILHAVRPL